MAYNQHSPEFKSKVALAAIKGKKELLDDAYTSKTKKVSRLWEPLHMSLKYKTPDEVYYKKGEEGVA
ncbi:MAG: hypothetical protein RBS89_01350 [Candidatus Delongbacteria bacterium]|jgi:hypothetical protein|nr:hypothetical protein [Candidatus Delongbacteria bacterium]